MSGGDDKSGESANVGRMDEKALRAASLLSDEEFAALMTAEHATQGADPAIGEGGVRRQLLLRRIEEALPERSAPYEAPRSRLRLGLWAGPLATAALMYFGVSSFLTQGVEEEQRVKGSEAGIPVRLLSYVTGSVGAELSPYPASGGRVLVVGETLVFDVNLTQPGVVALMVLEARAPLRQAYKLDVARAGEDTPLARGGEGYGYKIGPVDGAARICAVAAADENALAQVLEYLPPRFGSLPADACVVLGASPAP